MASRGRPRKSMGAHKQDGTYRPERHDGFGVDAPGRLVRPRGLNKNERWLWDTVVDGLPRECFGSIDEVALRMAATLWDTFMTNRTEDPKLAMQACSRLESILSRYGWSPADRAKLKTPASRPDDENARFFGITG